MVRKTILGYYTKTRPIFFSLDKKYPLRDLLEFSEFSIYF